MKKKISEKESDCREDCHYMSRYCKEQEDGSLKCPYGIEECVEKFCRGL